MLLGLRPPRHNELVKKVWGQGRDGVCSRTTMSNIHKPHLHTYPYMWCLEKLFISVQECFSIADARFRLIADWFSEVQCKNKPHAGICMQVWLVDVGHTCMIVLEHTTSLPCPDTFSPVHSYILFNLFKKFKCASTLLFIRYTCLILMYTCTW